MIGSSSWGLRSHFLFDSVLELFSPCVSISFGYTFFYFFGFGIHWIFSVFWVYFQHNPKSRLRYVLCWKYTQNTLIFFFSVIWIFSTKRTVIWTRCSVIWSIFMFKNLYCGKTSFLRVLKFPLVSLGFPSFFQHFKFDWMLRCHFFEQDNQTCREIGIHVVF